VVYVFDRTTEREERPLRPARGRPDLPPVGIFCDRGPRRPNRIGVTTAQIVAVLGRELRVRGLDAVNGTPVLDIKPAMLEFIPTGVRQPPWVYRLMSDYFSL
jgi:tRNA (Thr-GGU) A37 N-methylase